MPTVVRPGSAETFPSVRHGQLEDFTRVSDQRLWADSDQYNNPYLRVFVEVHLRADLGRQLVRR